MSRVLLTAIAVLGVSLLLALWRIDHVITDRDLAQASARQQQARADSLRNTLNLTRELASDQAAIEATYIEEKQRAETDTENLRRCLADGTCGLRVAATCPVVRVDGAGAAASEPDAGTPELTAAARRAYPALVAGLRQQHAQISGLQAALTNLHARCKIGAAADTGELHGP